MSERGVRTSPGARRRAEGELLAIQPDSIFILEHGAWFGLPTAQVAGATLTAHNPDTGPLALWTLAGTLSTASHGVGLILSAGLDQLRHHCHGIAIAHPAGDVHAGDLGKGPDVRPLSARTVGGIGPIVVASEAAGSRVAPPTLQAAITITKHVRAEAERIVQ